MTVTSMINRPLELSIRLFGVWPNSSRWILKGVTWTTLITTFLVFQYRYCVTHFKSGNLIELLDGISILLSNTLVLFKFVVIWIYRRTFHSILTTMLEDWQDHTSAAKTKQIMVNQATLSSRISNFLFVYYVLCYMSYVIIFFRPFGTNHGSDFNSRKLLLKMEFPFEVTYSPLYEVILVLQFVMEMFIALAASTMTALITALIIHVGSQVDVFCNKLQEISDSTGKHELPIVEIRDIVLRHQRILSLSRNIEVVFTYMSLMQFLANTMVICFMTFVLTLALHSAEGSDIIAKYVPYYIAINFEAFILCYTGEYLTSKGDSITQAVYNFSWYELRPSDTRVTVFFIILRSQSQLKLTAGKFVTLSLTAFAGMLKASASYVSVLIAML